MQGGVSSDRCEPSSSFLKEVLSKAWQGLGGQGAGFREIDLGKTVSSLSPLNVCVGNVCSLSDGTEDSSSPGKLQL